MRSAADVRFAFNPDPDRGMLTSLQAGLRELRESVDAVLFTPVDYPAILPATVAALAAYFREASSTPAFVVPQFGGRHGHPVLASAAMISEFLELPETSEARTVVHRHRDQTLYVDVSDEGILLDIDDSAAYERLLNLKEEAV
jgi:molybdenum cofactor cytidylyltransferase